MMIGGILDLHFTKGLLMKSSDIHASLLLLALYIHLLPSSLLASSSLHRLDLVFGERKEEKNTIRIQSIMIFY